MSSHSSSSEDNLSSGAAIGRCMGLMGPGEEPLDLDTSMPFSLKFGVMLNIRFGWTQSLNWSVVRQKSRLASRLPWGDPPKIERGFDIVELTLTVIVLPVKNALTMAHVSIEAPNRRADFRH